MMNLLNKQVLFLLTFMLIIYTGSAFSFSLFDDDDIIWEKNSNVYFKYANNNSRAGKNNHPVELDPQGISAALGPLKIKTADGLLSNGELQAVFTDKQVQTLAQQLSKGLSKAKSNQDIIFSLEKNVSSGLGLKSIGHFVAGRVFYKDDLLNIIIGDYDRPRDIGYEAVNDPTRIGLVRYKFDHGSRRSQPSKFKHSFVLFRGIENMQVNGATRTNWLVINTQEASKGIIKEARDAKKAELAKKRKELKEILGDDVEKFREQLRELESAPTPRSAPAVPSAPAPLSAEDRFNTLNKLLDKGLITDGEYQQKRQQIIDSL